jgi:hypothetical protein
MSDHGVERRTFECKQCNERQAFIVARASQTTDVMRHLSVFAAEWTSGSPQKTRPTQ